MEEGHTMTQETFGVQINLVNGRMKGKNRGVTGVLSQVEETELGRNLLKRQELRPGEGEQIRFEVGLT